MVMTMDFALLRAVVYSLKGLADPTHERPWRFVNEESDQPEIHFDSKSAQWFVIELATLIGKANDWENWLSFNQRAKLRELGNRTLRIEFLYDCVESIFTSHLEIAEQLLRNANPTWA